MDSLVDTGPQLAENNILFSLWASIATPLRVMEQSLGAAKATWPAAPKKNHLFRTHDWVQ